MNHSGDESKILREITRLKQEVVSLKTPQRYLTGQAKGFESNKLRLQSVSVGTYGSDPVYEQRRIDAELVAVGDHIEKNLIPTLRVQLYNSSGNPVDYVAGWGTGYMLAYAMDWASSSKNEHTFFVSFYYSAPSPADVFYGDFWMVANDSGLIKLVARHEKHL